MRSSVASMPWLPKDRTRTSLIMRVHTQHSSGGPIGLPEGIASRLSPETAELIAPASVAHTKSIATQAIVQLSSAATSEPLAGKPGSMGARSKL